MFYGSWGRILEIDINKKTIRVIELPENIYDWF